MIKKYLTAFILTAAGSALLTGCVGFSVKPVKPTGMPRADKPLPMKVGVLTRHAAFEWRGAGMSAAMMERQRGRSFSAPMFTQVDDIGGKFTRALQASGAFAQVVEIGSLGFNGSGGDHDLLIDGTFAGRYTQDPAMFGKAFMTGFLLLIPAPFVRYEDSYTATAELTLYDGSGRLVHKYNEQAQTRTSAALFSAGMPGSIAAGIESAAGHLAARLVATIIADRDGYKRAVSGRPPVARAPEPAAEPAGAAAAVEAVKDRSAAAQSELDAEAARHAAAAAAAAAANAAVMGEAAPAASPAPPAPPAANPALQPALDAAAEPTPKAEAPKPKKRGPLTPAEERAIDEELLP